MNPAEELAAAAFQLRNPFHPPGLRVGIDPELAAPLADWLDAYAEHLAASTHPDWQETTAGLPLAVARAILGQPKPTPAADKDRPRPAVSPCMCGYPDDEDVHHPTDGSDCRSTSTEPVRDWVADMVRDLKQP